ncbi:MAG: type 4a pilus biogenesis protein PilO [Candidatus Accumulibacter sp.]|jgi:type IV pilus assembly protein PilO|nr:type 4a pilus biogenesis protein PilO [Accumulibacter sp.]
MNLPSLSLPQISLESIRDDFRNLDPKDIGAWPAVPRFGVLVVLFVVVLVLGWFLFLSEHLNNLEVQRMEETKLREQYVTNKTQAVNLDLYMQQLTEMDRTFGVLLKQLPSKSEIESLLIEINQSGMGRGLQFDLFKPANENVKDFYAELPIALRVTGSYHDFGAFAEDIGKLSRIVTLGNIAINQVQQKEGVLVMEAVTKTYRYLDDAEIAAKRRAAQQARGGRR